MNDATGQTSPLHSRFRTALLFALIVAATLWVYRNVGHYQFLNYDDYYFIARNHHVWQGLTAPGLNWAFRNQVPMWTPLAWLSYMIDTQLFGVSSEAIHYSNLALHILAAGALYLFLVAATGRAGSSALATALFALHPLHVESVAWASERRDVLCALFWFLTLGAWVRFAKSRSLLWYTAALIACACGMMSKPIMLTIPFVLLIVDYWPLRRPFTTGRIYEKIPFFLICVAGAAATIFGPRNFGVDVFPADLRWENALNSIWIYLFKTIWPANLSVIYPFPETIPLWQPALALAALLAAGTFAWLVRRQAPWFTAGWLWYLITLIPVLGLIQTGEQSVADHYTYLPLTGVFIALAWGGASLIDSQSILRRPMQGASIFILAAISIAASHDAEAWRDTESLFRQALTADPSNYMAWIRLGKRHIEKGKIDAARAAFETALQLRPRAAAVHACFAEFYAATGQATQSIEAWEQASSLQPETATFTASLGVMLFNIGRLTEGVEKLDAAIALSPGSPEIHANLGLALAAVGTSANEGVEELRRAQTLDPHNGQYFRLEAQHWLSVKPPQTTAAIKALEEALTADPLDPETHIALADALNQTANGRTAAIREFEAAQRLSLGKRLKPDVQSRLNDLRASN